MRQDHGSDFPIDSIAPTVCGGAMATRRFRSVKPFGDALGQHGLGRRLIDRADLFGESNGETGETGSVRPLVMLPKPRPDQRLATMKEDLGRLDLKDGTGGLALHRQALAQGVVGQ